ncbi:MAG: hypothetical protein ACK54K_01025, partial [Gemmatimonadaceae bacterium]
MVFESTELGAMVYTTPRRVGAALGSAAYLPTLDGTVHVARDRSPLTRVQEVPPFSVGHTTL